MSTTGRSMHSTASREWIASNCHWLHRNLQDAHGFTYSSLYYFSILRCGSIVVYIVVAKFTERCQFLFWKPDHVLRHLARACTAPC